jgi:hypothetical protein
MAHTIFQLLVAFEFTATTGNWIRSSAVVLDWWRPEIGEVETDTVTVATQNGAGQTFQLRVEELMPEMFDICVEADAGEDIAALCSGLEQSVLVNTAQSATLRLGDAWSMRRDFLEKARSEGGVIEFLNRWGSWSSGRVEIAANVIKARSDLAAAMADRPEKWLRSHRSHLPIVSRRKDYPYFLIETKRCAPATRIATTIDFLNGLKFKVCARPDCAIPFAIESRHRKQYHDWYCAHLESVRRNRRKTK